MELEQLSYTLRKRLITYESTFFKLQKFDENHIIFSAPDADCLVLADNSLNGIVKKYKFKDNPLAMDVVDINNEKYVIAGCRNGKIYSHQANSLKEPKVDCEKILGYKEFEPENGKEVFVNDIVHSPWDPSIFFNCYINGSVAMWNLETGKRHHTFKEVHEKYTYKIRFHSETSFISCGSDCNATLTDIPKQVQVQKFPHPLPIWCAYPINRNQIATVGLTGRVMIWDLRSKGLIQFINNVNTESSFITTKENEELVVYFGDGELIKKWDRRKSNSELLSDYLMKVSAEAMLFDQERLYVCGRGMDLCLLTTTTQDDTLLLPLELKDRTEHILLEPILKMTVDPDEEDEWYEIEDQDEEEGDDEEESLEDVLDIRMIDEQNIDEDERVENFGIMKEEYSEDIEIENDEQDPSDLDKGEKDLEHTHGKQKTSQRNSSKVKEEKELECEERVSKEEKAEGNEKTLKYGKAAVIAEKRADKLNISNEITESKVRLKEEKESMFVCSEELIEQKEDKEEAWNEKEEQ